MKTYMFYDGNLSYLSYKDSLSRSAELQNIDISNMNYGIRYFNSLRWQLAQ